jgi:hypothetical protein
MKKIREEECHVPVKKYEDMTISECLLLTGIIDLIQSWNEESAVDEDGLNDELFENERQIFINHIADLRDILESVSTFYNL